MTPYGATWTHMGPHGSSLFYRFYVGSECGSRSNCLRKTGLPCFYDLSYERAGSPDFIDFSKFSKRGKMLQLFAQYRHPRFSSLEIAEKRTLIVCAVSAAPFSFFENVWFRVKDAYFRELLRISKKEKWVDFCLQYRQRHYMLLKTTMYLDLDVVHMRDHRNRGGPEAGNLRKQFKIFENFAFIFQIRKQQETRKNWIFPSIWSSLWFYVAILQWKM